VTLEERDDRHLDPILTPDRFGRNRRNSRNIRALLEPIAMGRSCSARSGKREAAITSATESLLAVDAVATEAKRPAARGYKPGQAASGYSVRVGFGWTDSTNRRVMTFPMTASSRAG
jgi:hypothetical protein